jgi:hypothetical protein
MIRRFAGVVALVFLLAAFFMARAEGPLNDTPSAQSVSYAPVYNADGQMVFPENYREWVYVTTGFDMDYNPDLNMGDHSMFDNVFVNPESYKAFLATGTWPDKTVLVLEGRMAVSKGSINKKGSFQATDVMFRSAHVKDARLPGGWAFFAFDDGKLGKPIPKTAVCYSCHEEHAAVDTTFVQFYPTLIEIAKQKHTLSPNYVKEEAASAAKEAGK